MTPAITFTSAITVTLAAQSGSDREIAEAAWTSTGVAEHKTDTDVAKVIPYLVKHRHGVPFEHGRLSVRVHAPIFVMRQLVEHRAGVSFSEESGRYRELEPVFYVPAPERPMVPAAGHKAARPEYVAADVLLYNAVAFEQEQAARNAWVSYQVQLDMGIAREVARNVLPVSIYSTAYITLNPRSLMHLLSLRTNRDDAAVKSFPQYEINQVADQIEALFAECWPVTHKAFNDAGRVCP